MDTDKWLTLPDDILVDIFRHLKTTAVIRCAAACRPWRRTIIDNASRLRPRPDCFLPELLLGFLEKNSSVPIPRRLQYVSAPNTAVPNLFTTPATGVGVFVDGRLYNYLLSSRDGFLLLRENTIHQSSLCLCNTLTGACKVLPAAALSHSSSAEMVYALATGYDVDAADDKSASGGDDGCETAVWIVATNWIVANKDGLMYQIFSSTSGEWGPVKCSPKLPEDVARAQIDPRTTKGAVVVCHGAVSCFVDLLPNLHVVKRIRRRHRMFSVDLRTGRTWTTELPDSRDYETSRLLAVSEDGRLSLVRTLPYAQKIEVWVLDGNNDGGSGGGGGSQWTLRRVIDDVHQKLLPNCKSTRHLWLSGFCPRSGYLFGFGTCSDRDNSRDPHLHHHFVIGVDGSSPRLIGKAESNGSASASITRFPYEMDWSSYIPSYISKMKYF